MVSVCCRSALTNKNAGVADHSRTKSHARTVVRECCKGDDEIQWEKGKFDPPPPKNPLTDGLQNLGISATMQNFIKIGLGVSVLRMGDFATLKWLGYFFWFLRKATAERRAPILTQNTSNDAVPRKEVPFGGRETKM